MQKMESLCYSFITMHLKATKLHTAFSVLTSQPTIQSLQKLITATNHKARSTESNKEQYLNKEKYGEHLYKHWTREAIFSQNLNPIRLSYCRRRPLRRYLRSFSSPFSSLSPLLFQQLQPWLSVASSLLLPMIWDLKQRSICNRVVDSARRTILTTLQGQMNRGLRNEEQDI